jgi:predicted Ser/Thr protein kinase
MTANQDRLTATLAERYALEREIGRGGMAVVYLARDLKHQRSVAVKVLRPEFAAAVGSQRFLREIEIASLLSHPHILPLYDSGQADGALFYVMPFVDGESLQCRLTREKQLSVLEAVNIAREIADALQHAHSKYVVHRDIKPGNVLLLSQHAVVSDFGVATLAQSVPLQRLTSSGVLPGTPLYMSPEQASGSDAVDGRSDIYSLGCVLYEMLSGEPPFRGPTPQAILARKLTAHPAPLHETREFISETLESVVEKALARAPADRYRTAAEFAAALETVLHEQRDTAHVGGAMEARTQERGGAERTSTTASSANQASSLIQLIGVAAVVLIVATAVGFLTTTVYDQVLNVPDQYTPSRLDFTILGVRALIPLLFTAFALLVGVIVLRQVGRLLELALSSSERTKGTLKRWEQRTRNGWQTLWRMRAPAALAEIWFVLAVSASSIVLAMFGAKVRAASDTAGGIFACAYRDVHTDYTVVMAGLILLIGVTWGHVFRHQGTKDASGLTYNIGRWGGIALIGSLVLIQTAPWRLLWTESPRATMNGERYYILRDAAPNLLLYSPRKGITERYGVDEPPELQRMNTSGYIFEDAQAFNSAQAGC